MENNEILNLILSKLDNLEKGQQDLKEEVINVKEEVTNVKEEVTNVKEELSNVKEEANNFRKEVNQRFDNLEKEIKQTNITIGGKIIVSSENLDTRIVDMQNTLLNKIDDIDDMKLSIEVLDIISKNNLKEINRLKIVK